MKKIFIIMLMLSITLFASLAACSKFESDLEIGYGISTKTNLHTVDENKLDERKINVINADIEGYWCSEPGAGISTGGHCDYKFYDNNSYEYFPKLGVNEEISKGSWRIDNAGMLILFDDSNNEMVLPLFFDERGLVFKFDGNLFRKIDVIGQYSDGFLSVFNNNFKRQEYLAGQVINLIEVIDPKSSTDEVFLSFSSRVYNFQIFKLNFVNGINFYIDCGGILLQKDYVEDQDVFHLKTILSESAPNVGISFEDTSGQTRVFAISFSGFDGSIELIPLFLTESD